MKRIVSLLLLVAVTFSFAACDGAAPKANANNYVDQQAFLEDMAKGISDRIENVDDEKERTDEELYAYYEKLVNYELSRISKYDSLEFEDSLFNELAHEYISGCKAQLTAAQHYKTLWSLWSAGSSIRNSIIVYMYQMYDLPITSEQASQYGSGTQNYIISFSNSSTDSDAEPFDRDAVREKIEALHINGQGKYGLGATLITNNSEEIIKVEYTVKYYQGSSVVATQNGSAFPIYPGETCGGWELDWDHSFTKTEVEINTVSRVSGKMAIVGGKISDIVTFNVSTSGENAIVKIKNNGIDGAGRFGYIVVFYYKGKPVDANYGELTLDYGQRGTESAKCKEGIFDSAKVFLNYIY